MSYNYYDLNRPDLSNAVISWHGGNIPFFNINIENYSSDTRIYLREYNDGSIVEEKWYYNGVLSRKDGPALLIWWHKCDEEVLNNDIANEYHTNCGDMWEIIAEEWYNSGKLHRKNMPAYIRTINDDIIVKYYEFGKEINKNSCLII